VSGGAIYNDGYNTLTGCIFTKNTATWTGGAIYDTGRSTLTKCNFTKNTAKYGGVLFNWCNIITLTACTFTKNTATESGGAIYNENVSTLTAKTCTFTENTAKKGDYVGAIYKVKGSKATITGCNFIPTSKSANLKLDKIITSKLTTKNGKRIYTKTYNYKNFGKATGSKTFTITIANAYKLSGKITKSANVYHSYNSKKITVTINKLAYNKITQVKFNIIQV